MQFIRLPKLLKTAERELPELVANWMNTKSVQSINTSFVQKFWVNMLISWVIEYSTSWMPYRCTFTNFTHRAWAILDLSNYDLFWIIPNPGSQKRITLSLETISTIPFQAGTSYVNIPEWGQHCSNRGMPCHVFIFGTFQGTWNMPYARPGVLFRWTTDIFWILPIMRYSSQACWSAEWLVKWVLSDSQMTGTMVAPAGSHSCISHNQSPVFIVLYIPQLPESGRRAGSNLRCPTIGRCGPRIWIHLKLSL